MPRRFLFLNLLLSALPREGEGVQGGGNTPASAPPAGAPPAAAPPAPAPPAGAQPFHAGFTDDTVRAFVEAKGIGDINALGKTALEANRYIDSTNADIRYPRDDAPDDVKNDFYKRIGRPETPDGYKFEHGEGVQVDPKFETFGKTLAHKLGLTPTQAQTMAAEFNGFVGGVSSEQAAAQGQQGEAAVAELKSSWGANFDANLADGQKAFRALGLPADKVSAIEAHMGTGPLMELMATLGKKMGGEAAFVPGGGAGSPSDPAQMSPAAAKVKLDTLSLDKTHEEAKWNKNHPQHKTAVEYELALVQAAHRKP